MQYMYIYIFTSKTGKVESHVCVTIDNFTCTLGENVCLGVFKSCLQLLPLCILHLLCFWAFLGHFGCMKSLNDTYPKKPVSVTKKDISDHIYQSIHISLWLYGSIVGCKNSSKMATFRPNMRVLCMTQCFLAGTPTHWKWLALTIPCNIFWKPKKGRYDLKLKLELVGQAISKH